MSVKELVERYIALRKKKDEIEAELKKCSAELINHEDEVINLYVSDEISEIDSDILPEIIHSKKTSIQADVFNDIPEDVLLLFAEKVWKGNVEKMRVAMTHHPELEDYLIEKPTTYIKMGMRQKAIKKALEKVNKDEIDEMIEDL